MKATIKDIQKNDLKKPSNKNLLIKNNFNNRALGNGESVWASPPLGLVLFSELP